MWSGIYYFAYNRLVLSVCGSFRQGVFAHLIVVGRAFLWSPAQNTSWNDLWLVLSDVGSQMDKKQQQQHCAEYTI